MSHLSSSLDPSRLRYFNSLKISKKEIQNKVIEKNPNNNPLSPRNEENKDNLIKEEKEFKKEEPKRLPLTIPDKNLEKPKPSLLSPVTSPIPITNSKPISVKNSHLRKKEDSDEEEDDFKPPHLMEKETSYSLAQFELKKYVNKNRNEFLKKM